MCDAWHSKVFDRVQRQIQLEMNPASRELGQGQRGAKKVSGTRESLRGQDRRSCHLSPRHTPRTHQKSKRNQNKEQRILPEHIRTPETHFQTPSRLPNTLLSRNSQNTLTGHSAPASCIPRAILLRGLRRWASRNRATSLWRRTRRMRTR